MLYKCANSSCNVSFRLGGGKLFQIEAGCRPAVRKRERLLRCVERYWLCDQCAMNFTLAVEKDQGVVTVPLGARAEPPQANRVHHDRPQPVVPVADLRIRPEV